MARLGQNSLLTSHRLMQRPFCLPLIPLLISFVLAAGTAGPEGVRTPMEDAEIQLNMANELYAREMWARATSAYEEFLKSKPALLHPRKHEALYRLGECLIQREKYSDAVSSFDGLIRKHPESNFFNNALFRRGTLRFLLRDPEQAIPDLKTLLERLEAKPEGNSTLPVSTKYFLGRAFRARNHLEEARPLLEAVAGEKQSEHRQEALKYLADVDFAMKNWKLAIADYESYRKECPKPEIPIVDFRLGQAYRELGEFDKAIAALRRIPNDNEFRDVARCIEIDSFFQKGEHAPVVQSFAALEAAHPAGDEFRTREDFSSVLYMAGVSHFKLKQYPDCIARFTELAKRFEEHPKLETASYLVCMSHYYLQDLAGMERSALAFLQKFAKPQNEQYLSDVHYLYGDALFGLKKYAGALPYLLKVPEGRDFHEPASQRTALCYLHLAEEADTAEQKAGHQAKAAQAYDAYVAKYPGTEFARNALLRSAELHQELQKYAEAELRFNNFLVAYKDQTDAASQEHALFSRAQCQLAQKKSEAMATSFAELLRRCPQTRHATYARYWIGRHYEDEQDWEHAIQFFLPVKNDPKHEFSDDAIHRLARCYIQTKQSKEACDTFLEIFKARPKIALPDPVFMWVARELAALKRPQDAIWVYQHLLETRKDTKFRNDCLYMIHALCYSLEEWENAAKWGEDLLAALEKQPDKRISKGQVLFQVGFSHHQLKAYRKAEVLFLRVKNEGAPPDLIDEAEFRLGTLYRQTGDYEKALDPLLKVGWFMPKFAAEAQYEAGLCLIKLSEKGDVKEGIRHLETLIKLWEGVGDRGLIKEYPEYEKIDEVKKLLAEKRKVLEEHKKQLGNP